MNKKFFKVTLLFKEIEKHNEAGKNLKVKIDTVKKVHNQPGSEVSPYTIKTDRFFEASVFHDPLNYGFLFNGCPLVIEAIQKVEPIKEKK